MGFNVKAGGATSLATGDRTIASGTSATAMGSHTVASGWESTALGSRTTASGTSAIAMGADTRASGGSSTALGVLSHASGMTSTAMGGGTIASDLYSTAMGFVTTASGEYTTAVGTLASTNAQRGSFVYGDASTRSSQIRVNATEPNSFVVRAQHVWFGKMGDQVAPTGHYIETSTGAYLSDAGVWSSTSDRDRKHDFRPADPDLTLRRIAGLPIHDWAYKVEDPTIRHVGPTAQDFYAAFGLGDSDKAIGSVDIDGVNMLAIQALEKRTRELMAENDALRNRLAQVEAMLLTLMESRR
jgi:hypothetical protein